MKSSKVCPGCGIEKPADQFQRNNSARNKTGLSCRCKACIKVKRDAEYRANPGYYKKKSAEWREKNKERFRQYMKRRQKTEGRTLRSRQMQRNYGITIDQYEQMVEAQGRRCACCGTDTPGGRGVFVIDHDHLTEKVRGLLCNKCNKAIGLLRDSVPAALNTARYLLQTSCIEDYAETGESCDAIVERIKSQLGRRGWNVVHRIRKDVEVF